LTGSVDGTATRIFRFRFKKSKHVTRKEKLLAKVDAIIPWHALEELIAPYYPKASNGRTLWLQ